MPGTGYSPRSIPGPFRGCRAVARHAVLGRSPAPDAATGVAMTDGKVRHVRQVRAGAPGTPGAHRLRVRTARQVADRRPVADAARGRGTASRTPARPIR